MIADYFYNDGPGSPRKRQQTEGSFGFNSSQFSQKNNNSIDGVKKMDPSFFNESSIRKLNNSESGEFIYFQNDSVLSELELELKGKKKSSQKQQQKQKKKKDAINYSREISFEDSLQKSMNMDDDSKIKEYGTGKSHLPLTVRKPKFGFKISQTAQSSAIMKDAEPSVVINEVNEEYQLKVSKKADNYMKNNNLKNVQRNIKQVSRHSGLQNSRRSIKENSFHKNQSSISSIKRPFRQPSVASKELSEQNSINGSMNFKSVFKQKAQKASVINSSLNKHHKHSKSNASILSQKQVNHSLSRNDLNDKQINIAQLKDLRELQNKLGELKHQNKKIIEYMIEKDQEIQQLKKKKIDIEAEDPYAVIKQNELMKAFLHSKPKRQSQNLKQENNFGYQKYLHSAKSLKQISLKKSSQISSLHDYDIKQHRFKVQTEPVTKTDKKFILSNRGMILSQKCLDVGYTMKDNFLTLYLTLKREYNEVRIKLEENSFILSENIDRVFQDSGVGKQIKFKTQIKSTKCSHPGDLSVPLCLKISLSSLHKLQNKINQFKVNLPITVYNIAKQLEMQENMTLSQKTSKISAKQVFKTQTFVSCKQMYRDSEMYLLRLFPTGAFFKDENVFQVGFVWKEKQDILRIRIKERSFVIEGEGNPSKGTFELLRNIVSLLVQERSQN